MLINGMSVNLSRYLCRIDVLAKREVAINKIIDLSLTQIGVNAENAHISHELSFSSTRTIIGMDICIIINDMEVKLGRYWCFIDVLAKREVAFNKIIDLLRLESSDSEHGCACVVCLSTNVTYYSVSNANQLYFIIE